MQQFTGTWIYRSFSNSENLRQAFNDIEFGRGLMIFDIKESNIQGEFVMGENFKLQISGTIQQIQDGPYEFRWTGTGVAATGTEGWVYDYHGYLDKNWDNGINQAVTITGTVIRTVPHGNAPAGVVGTFNLIKVKS